MALPGELMSPPRVLGLHGILPVFKPVGESSAKTVSRVKDALLSSLPRK